MQQCCNDSYDDSYDGSYDDTNDSYDAMTYRWVTDTLTVMSWLEW